MEFNKTDVRKLIYYCWKREMNGVEICNEINEVLGDETVSVRTCQVWISKFKNGDFNVKDQDRSGRPSLDGVDERIEECLIENKHATSREIASYLDCHQTTVVRHLKALGKKFLVSRWIPHRLTPENMNCRLQMCAQNLAKFNRNNFLNQLITVDETWIFWDTDGCKPGSHNRNWLGSGDAAPMVVKQTPMTTRKHMATVFWDVKGVLLIKNLPKNTTMTAQVYCDSLEELKDALIQKRRRIANQGFQNFHFLHDNARPHTAQLTQQKLADLGFSVVPHPPYSPDLAPSDYYLFSSMKAGLSGATYNGVEEVDAVLDRWIESKPADFFRKGIHMLPERWQRCIDAGGDYFHKMHEHD